MHLIIFIFKCISIYAGDSKLMLEYIILYFKHNKKNLFINNYNNYQLYIYIYIYKNRRREKSHYIKIFHALPIIMVDRFGLWDSESGT